MNKTLLIMLICSMILTSSNTYSQTGKVPPFQIIQSNGKLLRAENLPLGKSIVIIYFSPECEDCQQLTRELINRIDEFEKASIVMITYLSKDNILRFASEYNLDKYSNLFVGTEGDSYFVGSYYKVGHLPFIALYNKNGDLIKTYDKGFSIQDLVIRLWNL